MPAWPGRRTSTGGLGTPVRIWRPATGWPGHYDNAVGTREPRRRPLRPPPWPAPALAPCAATTAVGIRRRAGRAAEEPPGAAPRRGAGVRARADRHAACRRRQGQPVLPARLQPRPRHRLRHLGRRHAGQHAHPRAWPGLHRPELPAARTGAAHRVPQGPVLRAERRLRVSAGSADIVYLRRLDAPFGQPDAGAERLPARRRRCPGRGVAGCHPARRAGADAQRRPLDRARAAAAHNLVGSLAGGTLGAGLERAPARLPRQLDQHRPDPAAR
jgi:hypothetical protein